MYSINPTEKFELIVIFDDSDSKEELLGITELEQTLENVDLKLYIKESECSNVVFVECERNCVEAAKQIKNTPSKRISHIIPINSVLKTNFDEIISKIRELSLELIESGDTFNVKCDVMKNTELTKDQIIDVVKADLIDLNLKFDDKNPKWQIYIGVIGENTGLSIIKSNDLI
ncbi:MAG: THUMP domain-containing protein [Methanobacterium sp.]|uniref:THUMP domain-containing protein n=1 Tax=Methanobacterium sp. TaxID=2164 RepID=UPI003C7384F1